MFIQSANEYELARDGSGILIQGNLEGTELTALPIEVKRNAVHIVPHPALGVGLQVVTSGDGIVSPQIRLPKSKQDLLANMDWHFKIMFLPVNLPFAE